jgi:hypothetical protein
MEKAKKIKDITSVWKYYNVKNNEELYQTNEMQYAAKRHDLQIKDFGRAANWGFIDDHPVIIDFGFTFEVCKKYYSPSLGKLLIRKIEKFI